MTSWLLVVWIGVAPHQHPVLVGVWKTEKVCYEASALPSMWLSVIGTCMRSRAPPVGWVCAPELGQWAPLPPCTPRSQLLRGRPL